MATRDLLGTAAGWGRLGVKVMGCEAVGSEVSTVGGYQRLLVSGEARK